jgi:hypothetical protein
VLPTVRPMAKAAIITMLEIVYTSRLRRLVLSAAELISAITPLQLAIGSPSATRRFAYVGSL